MNRNADLKARFPNISADCLALNSGSLVATRLPDPQPEPAHWPKPLRDDAAPKEGSGRLVVCITRHSTGTLDRDNLWGGAKAVCDALRYAGLIPDDDPASIFLVVRQRKCKRKDQGTEILITPCAP